MKYVNTMMMPTFDEVEHAWRQVIPFSDGNSFAELHLFYHVEDQDWSFSSIFYKDGSYSRPDLTRDRKTIFELYENAHFQSFLRFRKEIYDDMNHITTKVDPAITSISLHQTNEEVCVFDVMFEGASIPWKFEFIARPFGLGWNLNSIQIHHGEQIFGNLLGLFPLEDFVKNRCCEEHLENACSS